MLQRIIDEFPDEKFIIADGFDKAVIGFDEHSFRLIYSVSKCIKILMKQGMTEEDAREYFGYNVSGGHFENSPIWCNDCR